MFSAIIISEKEIAFSMTLDMKNTKIINVLNMFEVSKNLGRVVLLIKQHSGNSIILIFVEIWCYGSLTLHIQTERAI